MEKFKFKPLHSGMGFHPPKHPNPIQPPPAPIRPKGAIAAGPPQVILPPPSKLPLQEPPKNTLSLGSFYLLRRFLAFVFDTILNVVVGGASLLTVAHQMNIPLSDFQQPEVFVICMVFLIFFSWSLITAQEIAFHSSIGKRFLGLHLTETSSFNLLVRAIGFFISLSFFGLGLIWALFDSKKRCWHDLLGRSQPERWTANAK